MTSTASLTLAQLLQDVQVIAQHGVHQRPISGIAYDSRAVERDGLFLAQRGFHVDGHRFIEAALERGAAAVVYDDPDWRAEDGSDVPALCARTGAAAVQVADSRVALSPLAAAFYGNPGRELLVVGVTGTKGKSTTSTLISAVLDAEGHSSGLITTVDFKVGADWWPNDTRQTTPEALEIQQMLRRMADAGCDYAVVESSSHGLSPRWNRLGDCEYDVAVFTNVTHEHIDYHGTVEQYRLDKAQLFDMLGTSATEKHVRGQHVRPRKVAIVNLDDEHAELYIEHAGDADIVTYAVEHPGAHVRAIDVAESSAGIQLTADTPWGMVELDLPIVGRFNVPNILAALSVGLSQDIDPQACAEALANARHVRGRMERIDEGQPFAVLVDYAHNPDSFEKLLSSVRPIVSGKLIAVFGSAGERDVQKRPIQGAIAARYCQLLVITDEDPRLEDREAILREIAAGAEQEGLRENEGYLLIADREAAIRAALERAAPGDMVLLLGKGHESCIIYADHKLPWDEADVARRLLRAGGYGTGQRTA